MSEVGGGQPSSKRRCGCSREDDKECHSGKGSKECLRLCNNPVLQAGASRTLRARSEPLSHHCRCAGVQRQTCRRCRDSLAEGSMVVLDAKCAYVRPMKSSARCDSMVDVSVGSWHHLVEHDGIQENEAASNQECQIINSELLAAREATSMLGRHLQSQFTEGQNFLQQLLLCMSNVNKSTVKPPSPPGRPMFIAWSTQVSRTHSTAVPRYSLTRRMIHQRALPR